MGQRKQRYGRRLVSTASKVALMDFPSELLNLICQQVDLNGLLALACLCIRLHHMALEVHFAQIGFNGSSILARDQTVDKTFFKLLRGIRLSFSITKLDHVDCELNVERIGRFGVLNRMKELQKLFDRPTYVSRIILRFTGVARVTTYWNIFFTLLNSITNTECDRLHIQFPTFHSSESYRSRIGSRFRWNPTRTIKEITISINNTFLESSLKWLVLSINSSPVQIIRFSSPGDMETLPLFLSQAELPHLTELHISSTVAAKDIFTFLVRHPKIKTLDVSCTMQAVLLPQLRIRYRLRCLTKLAASTDIICHILSTGQASKLHAVYIRPPYSPLGGRSLLKTLIALSKCPSIHRLSLFIDKDQMITCLRVANDRPTSRATYITHLTLFQSGLTTIAIELLVQWIVAFFPELETLVLHELFSSNERISFRKQLSEAKSLAVHLSFNDDETGQPVSQWLYDGTMPSNSSALA